MSTYSNKKIVIFGTGGIGGYFGGLLANKGLNVTFVARGEHLETMKNNGLRVDSVDGDFLVNPVQAIDDRTTIGQVDLIMVCVKSPQVKEVATLIKPLVNENTLILPLQNGVEAPRILIEAFSKTNVIGGLCKVLSHKVGPGHIRHSGFSVIELGEMDGPVSTRIEAIKEILTFAGINVVTHDDFPTALWNKMVMICGWGGVTAVTRSSLGVIRSIPETREMIEKSMYESVQVAQGLGINVSDKIVEAYMNATDSLPYDTTTSLQRDIMTGKPSELEFLLGSIVRYGKELEINTPINNFLYYSLLPQEREARRKRYSV
ncbi:MAG: ketopantoate reductase family protein [Candidatus Hodarchaeales archaeon]